MGVCMYIYIWVYVCTYTYTYTYIVPTRGEARVAVWQWPWAVLKRIQPALRCRKRAISLLKPSRAYSPLGHYQR